MISGGGFESVLLILTLLFYGLVIAWAVTVLRRLREHSTLLTQIATELRAQRESAQRGAGGTDEP